VTERRERRTYELAVVMPVHNEQDCIAVVVRSWHDLLRRLGVDFIMLVIDDGSTDATARVLQEVAADRIQVSRQTNRGHGPTILGGYREATRRARWVFQCDSDDEMPPDAFPRLWQVRDQYEAVFGYRQAVRQSLGRKLVSAGARATVRLAFGGGVRDVNTPYRLIRSDVLRPIVDRIGPDTFAPNVLISGALARARVRIGNLPVPHRPRRTGATSIVKWKLWRAAFRSFGQTLSFRLQPPGGDSTSSTG
jgi:dolichol-phosphate mannosyltransferase